MVAKRMRDKAEALEEEMVDVRKEDKTIRPFTIPHQPELIGEVIHISSVGTVKNNKAVNRKVDISLKRNYHLLLSGPNGIGKSTLLESIASLRAKGIKVADGVRIGYYRQDFSTLNFEDTVHDSLKEVMEKEIEVARKKYKDSPLKISEFGKAITSEIGIRVIFGKTLGDRTVKG